jgi:hypothetical protein
LTEGQPEYKVLGMTTKILALAAGAGAMIFLHVSWVVAIIIAGTAWYLLRPTDPEPTTLIHTIDITTGRTKLQPFDKAAQDYLSTRKD